MGNSILITIKKLLGIDPDNKDFDTDLISHINSVFMILYQIGVGPSSPYVIQSDAETWDDFLGDEVGFTTAVISYVYAKVRLLFDTSTLTSSLVQSLANQANELEARLNYMVDPKIKPLNKEG
jgi:hypothetical protein